MVNESLIIETTYFDRCSIFRKEKKKNDKTGVTELIDTLVYEDIKCAVSRGSQTVTSTTDVAVAINTYKLYANPKYLIKPGDIVSVVFENGLQADFTATTPVFYSSHSETNLSESVRC